MMTHKEKLHHLESLGWHQDVDSGRHQICGERCVWIFGKIAGVEWSGWMSEISGMVYLHTDPAIDLAFDAFCNTVANGWPEKKVVPKSRGFDFGEDD